MRRRRPPLRTEAEHPILQAGRIGGGTPDPTLTAAAAQERALASPSPTLATTAGQPRRAFVYVIGGPPDVVKIGMASDVHKRRIALQTASPHTLRVLFQLPVHPDDALSTESHAHWLLREHRRAGEWFAVSAAIAAAAIKKAHRAVSKGTARSDRVPGAPAATEIPPPGARVKPVRPGELCGLDQLLKRGTLNERQHAAALAYVKCYRWAGRASYSVRAEHPNPGRYIDARRWLERVVADVDANCGAEAIGLLHGMLWAGHKLRAVAMESLTADRAESKIVRALDVIGAHLSTAPWSGA